VNTPEDRKGRNGRSSRMTYGTHWNGVGHPNKKAAPPSKPYLNVWNGFRRLGSHCLQAQVDVYAVADDEPHSMASRPCMFLRFVQDLTLTSDHPPL